MAERTYLSIDLKSFYASVECVERGLDPLTTNLLVADTSRTDKTICLAVSPALKTFGLPGRVRLYEAKARVDEANRLRGAIARKAGKPVRAYNEDLLYDLFGVNAELLIDHAWGYEPCRISDIKAYVPRSKSLPLGMETAASSVIMEALTRIFDQVVDPRLYIRRLYVVADRVMAEREVRTDQASQLDFFGRMDEAGDEGPVGRSGEEAPKKDLDKERRVQEALVEIKMSRKNRAAQFSPFQALTGYEVAIQEAGRPTRERAQVSQDEVDEINRALAYLTDRLAEGPGGRAGDHPCIRIRFFREDERKEGGAYLVKEGRVAEIRAFRRLLLFEDGEEIPIDQLREVEIMGEGVGEG